LPLAPNKLRGAAITAFSFANLRLLGFVFQLPDPNGRPIRARVEIS
jgi:hypothetical protein